MNDIIRRTGNKNIHDYVNFREVEEGFDAGYYETSKIFRNQDIKVGTSVKQVSGSLTRKTKTSIVNGETTTTVEQDITLDFRKDNL